jgi:hypothetical protein
MELFNLDERDYAWDRLGVASQHAPRAAFDDESAEIGGGGVASGLQQSGRQHLSQPDAAADGAGRVGIARRLPLARPRPRAGRVSLHLEAVRHQGLQDRVRRGLRLDGHIQLRQIGISAAAHRLLRQTLFTGEHCFKLVIIMKCVQKIEKKNCFKSYNNS